MRIDKPVNQGRRNALRKLGAGAGVAFVATALPSCALDELELAVTNPDGVSATPEDFAKLDETVNYYNGFVVASGETGFPIENSLGKELGFATVVKVSDQYFMELPVAKMPGCQESNITLRITFESANSLEGLLRRSGIAYGDYTASRERIIVGNVLDGTRVISYINAVDGGLDVLIRHAMIFTNSPDGNIPGLDQARSCQNPPAKLTQGVGR